MRPVYIPQLLSATDRTETLSLEIYFSDLETLMPVRGELTIRHCMTYLEVRGKADTIVTLTCDRCLCQYNHRLSVDATELIWLEEGTIPEVDGEMEKEVAPEDLVETLPSQGYFEPDTWLYEQLCLMLPQRQICDEHCQGISNSAEQPAPEAPVDSRWSALVALKRQFGEA